MCSSDLELVSRNDKYGKYAWLVISKIILYASSLIPSVTKDYNNIDEAMRLGFNWIKGPFEMLEELGVRSEERRVGKECRSRWSPYHEKKNEKHRETKE